MSDPRRKPKSPPKSAGEKPAAPASAAESGDEYSAADIAALNEEARLYPWKMFSFGQLRAMVGVNAHVLGAVAGHKQTPFKVQKKGRPEWLARFLENPPADFSVK